MTRRLRTGLAAPLARRLRRLGTDASGQVLPMVAIMLLALLGITALALDVGRAFYSQRELQASTDSAALAGAQVMLKPGELPAQVVTNYTNAAQSATATGSGGVVGAYSSITGGFNQTPTLSQVTETATLKCLASLEALGHPCIEPMPYNAVQVTQTAVLPMYFAGLFGHSTLSINATSTASARGGPPKPANIAVIVDTTLSEAETDPNCPGPNGQSQTEMQCSLNGLRVLLQTLQPCGINQPTCSATGGVSSNSFDRVALFTFPNLTPATVSLDYSCTQPVPTPSSQNKYYNLPYDGTILVGTLPMWNVFSSPPYNNAVPPYGSIPTAAAYTFPIPGASSYSPLTTSLGDWNTQAQASNTFGPATYQVTSYFSDYRTSNESTTLNTNSALVKAAGGAPGCGGMAPPNWEALYQTYYAGVLYAAQASLVAEQAANPGSENVIILISDGDANAPQHGLLDFLYTVPSMPSSGVTNPATSSGLYPSWNQECAQAVAAANYATSQGTTVYTVAYGSKATGCASDTNPATSPCETMFRMASAPQEFYSDQGNSACPTSQPVTALADILQAIGRNITEARLIPNNTT